MSRTNPRNTRPSARQLAWRESFGRKYGGRMRELVKREREVTDARTQRHD